jgi:tetratricopeptide (TPR) repeat protein
MKYKLIILLSTVVLFSCKHSKYDPEAIKLNNKAVAIKMNYLPGTKPGLDDAIILLDSATKIDSNYVIAYWNKFIFQNKLKRYNDALLTGKRIIKLRPKIVTYRVIEGVVYEKTGDKLTAEKYYNQGLLIYNKLLDTMNSNNKMYKQLEFEKASDLIFLHQEQKGLSIIKDLYDKETDSRLKIMYRQFMNISRENLLSFKTSGSTKILEKAN